MGEYCAGCKLDPITDAFKGYVITDWFAQHTGIASANAGLDVVMPSSSYWNGNLTTAISNGTMEASRLDDMITR